MEKEPIRTGRATTLTIAIRPDTRAMLSALSALLQESMGRVVEKGLDALLDTLQSKDVEAVKALAGRAMQKMEITSPDKPERNLADDIRDFVFRRYIEPARRRGDREIRIKVGEVHREMKLSMRQSAVSAALGADKFPKRYDLERLRMDGPTQGSSAVFIFRLR